MEFSLRTVIWNNGRNKQILYNIMGGQEKAFIITAGVTDFALVPVSFTGIPMSFDLNIDDMDTGTLEDKTDKLKDGVRKLDDGTGKGNKRIKLLGED